MICCCKKYFNRVIQKVSHSQASGSEADFFIRRNVLSQSSDVLFVPGFDVTLIFHNFLFQMYVVCSVLLFSLSKFIEEYDLVYRIYLLPYLLPMAHVGLMGSVYCTLALTIERFLAVCYPFLKHR